MIKSYWATLIGTSGENLTIKIVKKTMRSILNRLHAH